ncbi:MAG: hypothetical protein CSA95_07215 [Bacteroidetes bacterium]|nr:MAG: hypothetical protein CSA95_07215 [Bacteroidota bacterium]
MKLFKLFPLLILLLYGLKSHGEEFPFEISEIYSSSSIVNYSNQKLILIDFWATWCGPCKAATKQLEILQEELKEEVFMVSVTDESHKAVDNYMKRSPIQLMVLRDEKGTLIRKFNVQSRPYAVLLSYQGEVLWSGHPSGLSLDKLKRFARSYQHSHNPLSRLDDLFSVSQPSPPSQEVFPLEEDSEITIERIHTPLSLFSRTPGTVQYDGLLFNLIAKIYRVPKHLVTSDKHDDFYIQMKSPARIWDTNPDTLIALLSQQFNIQIIPQANPEEVFILKVIDKEKLWNSRQINWGEENTANHLISENRIQADNLTIAEFCILLSDTKKEVYKYFGEDYTRHDWDVHIHFNDLMEGELLNEFGIVRQKRKLIITRFLIQ